MFGDTSIRIRLVLFATAFVVGLVLLGGLGVYSGQRALDSMRRMYENDARAVEVLGNIKANMLDAAADMSLIMSATGERKKAVVTESRSDLRMSKEAWEQFKTIPNSPQALQLGADYERHFMAAHDLVVQLVDAAAEGNLKAMAAVDVNTERLWGNYVAASEKLVTQQKSQAKTRYDESVTFFSRFVRVVIGTMFIGVCFALLLCWNLILTVIKPLDAAVANCEMIASGNLASPLQGRTGKNEIGRLFSAFSAMQAQLSKLVAAVKQGTASIEITTTEITEDTLHSLSQRTQGQVASLRETASSMAQLTGVVAENAASARQANQLTLSASAVACKGSDIVTQLVETMASVSASSKKIVEIIAVIDGIAFQTNILALNAAVEAARAGAQGRGFAVVAAEVRILAQRSADAAKQISGLIGDSVNKVGVGSDLVTATGRTMGDIVASVKQVSDIMAAITSASQVQASEIERINESVNGMDQSTLQNAALVAQATKAAETMQQQVSFLGAAVSIFELDVAYAPMAPRAVPRTSMDTVRTPARRATPKLAPTSPTRLRQLG